MIRHPRRILVSNDDGINALGIRTLERIARTLSDAGINFRGMSAIAMSRKFVSFIALDSAEDQAKAVAALKKLKA